MSNEPKKRLSEAEWKSRLSPAQYHVLREHGTERPGSGPHLDEKRPGTFICAGCGNPLFDTAAKYESGSGWPSFWQPLAPGAVSEHEDRKLFMRRTEVRCANCEGHLGHVFTDGPRPTGLRYCMNGTALDFRPASGEKDGEA